MSILNRYGPMDKPEEKTRLAVIENPVDVAKAAYELWRPVAERSGAISQLRASNLTCFTSVAIEAVYDEAVTVLKPHAELFGSLQQGELEAILASVKPEDSAAAGLFLSALLNATELPMLASSFTCNVLGYRLAAGKTLVVKPGSEIAVLGYRAEGTLLNYGYCSFLAPEAEKGVQVNFGEAMNTAMWVRGGVQINLLRGGQDFAEGAKGGVQLNAKHCEKIASGASGGCQINLKRAYRIGCYAFGGTQVNAGYVKDRMGDKMEGTAFGGRQFNYGRMKNTSPGYVGRVGSWAVVFAYVDKHDPEFQNSPPVTLLRQIRGKVGELRRFGQEAAFSERIAEAVKSCDWQAYEKDVLSLTARLEAVLK